MATGETARGEVGRLSTQPGRSASSASSQPIRTQPILTQPISNQLAVAPQAADADPRISALVAEQQHRPEALIEILHRLQAQGGYLPKQSLRQLAQELGLPESRVFGVASFYHLFRLEPPRRHRCAVCLGSACFVLGAASLAARLEQRLGLRLERPTGSANGASLTLGSMKERRGAERPTADERRLPAAPRPWPGRRQEPLSQAPLSPEALSLEATQIQASQSHNNWSLEPVSCLGACGQAPLLVVDGRMALRLPIGSDTALEARLDRLGLPRDLAELASGGC